MKTGIKLFLLFTSLFVSLVFIRIIRINSGLRPTVGSYIGIGLTHSFIGIIFNITAQKDHQFIIGYIIF